jgi:hypothetical protein
MMIFALHINRCKVHTMYVLQEARHLIGNDLLDESAKILSGLVLALEKEVDFAISDIYQLNREHFDRVLKILKEWRLDCYYAGKPGLFDAAVHVAELTQKG